LTNAGERVVGNNIGHGTHVAGLSMPFQGGERQSQPRYFYKAFVKVVSPNQA